ncbi:tetratricopeptide (TPR) repeat protein [Pseudomonas nitritireducens]|uniref:Tetratricopeptide (TPR) repeat protein n=1 Tax=Pseudomonas nitroreducens TaxID=46680 RepID=A0A7W7P4P6_PSENT|nr:tetratricopeptide repeat protein [Pseudomonas nitritireducens]MBB4867109.1 tetratricopeptide (TPR) repeat protein [Pseudomonas nitritireducens]
MTDPFIEIHELLRGKDYETAFNRLYNKNTNSISEEFKEDYNHAWYIIGDIFFKSSNYEMAIHSFKKALESRIDDIEAYRALANSYSAIGAPEKSCEQLNTALQFSPNDPILNYNLGNAFFDIGDYKKAIKAYEKVPHDQGEIYTLAQENIKRSKDLVS